MTTTDYLYAPNSFVPTQTPPVNAPHDYTELSLPILHSDTGTFTLILDTEFFDQNRHIGTVPTQWDTDALRVRKTSSTSAPISAFLKRSKSWSTIVTHLLRVSAGYRHIAFHYMIAFF